MLRAPAMVRAELTVRNMMGNDQSNNNKNGIDCVLETVK